MTQQESKPSSHPYQKLQIKLVELINNAQPGERLPSEPELARNLGVSRATLREAMRTFEGQGLIRRRQGIGTFVVSQIHVMQSGLEVLESIETLAERINLDVSMGELRTSKIFAGQEEAEALQLAKGTPLVRVARIILAEDRPIAHLIDILPEDVLSPSDLQIGFTGSVLDFILQRGTPALTNSLTEVRAVAAPSDIAHALEIQRGDVLLTLFARLYTTMGRAIDYSSSYFLPGYFRFFVVRRVGGNILPHK